MKHQNDLSVEEWQVEYDRMWKEWICKDGKNFWNAPLTWNEKTEEWDFDEKLHEELQEKFKLLQEGWCP